MSGGYPVVPRRTFLVLLCTIVKPNPPNNGKDYSNHTARAQGHN